MSACYPPPPKIRDGQEIQRSSLPADPKNVRDHLTKRLNTAYDLFLKTAPDNTYATVDETGWHLSTDAARHSTPKRKHS